MTADLLEGRVTELEQRARRFKLATTGMEGWENYFQNLILQERDYFVDLLTELVARLQRDILDEAKAMLDRAISALKSDEATALSQFNDPSNKQFRDHDLSVFCYNISDGKITAYESPALLNVDVRTLSLKDDPIGKRVFKRISLVLGSMTMTERQSSFSKWARRARS